VIDREPQITILFHSKAEGWQSFVSEHDYGTVKVRVSTKWVAAVWRPEIAHAIERYTSPNISAKHNLSSVPPSRPTKIYLIYYIRMALNARKLERLR
jgi:hypothetical protein